MDTKIFLDSGDPAETAAAVKTLGFLDGQTTNPSLIAKNPSAVGKKFATEEVFSFYHKVIKDIAKIIPKGSISIEVYADKDTKAEEMLLQAKEYINWSIAPHIKLPINPEGLKAAEILVKQGVRVNMTLCFSQEQAAAVFAATRGAVKGQVFISPFIGRLDDIGLNGLGLVENIVNMYKTGDGHVEVLAASIRSLHHIRKCLDMGVDIITAPLKILTEWHENKNSLFSEEKAVLNLIEYKELDLEKSWQDFNINHDLTDKGLAKFAEDWNSLIA